MVVRDPNTAGGAKSVGRVQPDPQLRRSCPRLLLNKRTSPVPREQTAALGGGGTLGPSPAMELGGPVSAGLTQREDSEDRADIEEKQSRSQSSPKSNKVTQCHMKHRLRRW